MVSNQYVSSPLTPFTTIKQKQKLTMSEAKRASRRLSRFKCGALHFWLGENIAGKALWKWEAATYLSTHTIDR
eukprot:scaffold7165_cov68-Cyclotella_meneghiniana.AAC.2